MAAKHSKRIKTIVKQLISGPTGLCVYVGKVKQLR